MCLAWRFVQGPYAPPKPEANWPQQVEVLSCVASISIGTKLRHRFRVEARLHAEEQFATASKPLHEAFQGQQTPTDRKDPQEEAQASWQDLMTMSHTANRPGNLLLGGLAQQPIPNPPKGASETETGPKTKPARSTVTATGQPAQVWVIHKTELGWMICGPCVESAYEAVAHGAHSQTGKPSLK